MFDFNMEFFVFEYLFIVLWDNVLNFLFGFLDSRFLLHFTQKCVFGRCFIFFFFVCLTNFILFGFLIIVDLPTSVLTNPSKTIILRYVK